MAVCTRIGGTLVVTVRLTLMPGRDDALITAIQSAPRGTLAPLIREMMRHGGVKSDTIQSADEPEPDMANLAIEL